ncbi:MAG: XrtA/PEP-CTERM system TPR-repeat protein PrsT [Burkholderiales bacterium]
MKSCKKFHLRAAVAATVVAAALAVGCGEEKPAALVASAKDYIAKNDYKASTIQLKNALQKEPQNAEARYLLGVSLEQTGDYASAEKEFRRALEYKYSPEAVYPELAKVLGRQGEFKKIVSELGTATVSDPSGQAALKTALADAYLGLGQPKEARAAYGAALKAKSDYPRARIGEARLTAIDRDLAGAMKITDEVLAQSPGLPEALALKADLLLADRKPEEATKVLRELVKAEPLNGQARMALVSLLIDSKKYDEAAAEIAEMKKAAPQDPRASYLEAMLAFRKNEPEKARDAVQEVLKVAPDHLPSQLLAGAVDFQLGRFVTAEDHLRKVLARAPQSLYARNLLVATLLRTGQAAKAEDALEPALAAAPNDPGVLRLAGELAFATGDTAKAVQYFDRAAAADKDNAGLRTRLGQMRLATGDVERAMKDFETASELDPTQGQADLALVATHMRKREFDKALAATATLEKKQPKSPVPANLRGVILAAKGDVKGARENFEKALALQGNFLPAARNLARLDLAEKQPDAAKKRMETILATEPGNEGAILSLAEIQQATGATPQEVVATLERGIKANPNSAVARLGLVNYYARTKDNKSALAAAQAAAAALPDNPQVLEVLGVMQQANGAQADAIATFNKLVTVQPQSLQGFMRLAGAQFGAKDYDGSIKSLRQALSLRPDYADAQRQIVAVQLAAGKAEDALAEARAVQKAKPKEALGFALEGDVLASQKKFAEAVIVYREAMRLQPAAPYVIRLHGLTEAAGKGAEGEAIAAKWIKDNPKDAVVRHYLADRELKQKDYRDAARLYKEVLAVQPNNAVVLNNLAWALNETKDPSALSVAEKALSLAPTSPVVADTLGWILLSRGETKRGVELLKKAAAVAPNAAEIRLHYAQGLIKTGDKDGARKELEAIEALGDTPVKAEAQSLLKSL